MGLLDLPASLLSWLDAQLTILPAGGRVALWGVLGACLSMTLYWAISPQSRFASIAGEEQRLKARLRDVSLEMEEGLRHARRLLRLAIVRLALVLPSTAIAILPILCLGAWLQAYYAYDFPDGEQTVEIRLVPAGDMEGRWIARGAAAQIDIVDRQGGILQSVPVAVPVARIETRSWRDRLIGNPSGYLPENGPVQRIEIGLPRKQYLPWGPEWLRGWETIFVLSLLVVSLLIKFIFRVR